MLATGQSPPHGFKDSARIINIAWPRYNLKPASTPAKIEPTFSPFSRLPPELRVRIWKLALPDPRIVQSKLLYPPDTAGTLMNIKHTLSYGGEHLGEEHLSMCRESRQVFMENYHQISVQGAGGNTTFSVTSDPLGNQYIDGRRDTLVLDVVQLEKLGRYGYSLDLSRLENVALADTFVIENHQSILAYVHQMCPLLKKLSIISNNAHDPTGLAWSSRPKPVRIHLMSTIYDLYNMMRIEPLKDVDNSWRRQRIINTDLNLSACLQRSRDLRQIIKQEARIYFNDQKAIEIEVVIAGYAGPVRENFEVVNVVPRIPQPYGVCYTTRKPCYEPCIDYRMGFSCLEFSFSCRKDGTLDSPYDGMKELFEGED